MGQRQPWNIKFASNVINWAMREFHQPLTFILTTLMMTTMIFAVRAENDSCDTLSIPKYCSCSGVCNLTDGQVQILYDKKKTFTILGGSAEEDIKIPGDFFAGFFEISRLSIRATGIKSFQPELLGDFSDLVYLEILSPTLNLLNSDVLLSSLIILVITGTEINVLPSFNPTCNLYTLILSRNKIESIENLELQSCIDLHIVDFSENVIQSLPSNLLTKCDNLQSISFRHNNITAIPEDFFDACLKLEELDLSQNNLKNLSVRVFSSLTQIRYLYLESNDLHAIPSELFAPLKHLEVINLNNNKLGQLPDHLFGNCDLLRLLLLKGNLLQVPPISLIENCTLLHVVQLSDNQLTSVPSEFFTECKSVSVIGLENNKLKTLPVDLFSRCHQLRTLELDGNQLETFEFEVLSPVFRRISAADNKLKTLATRKIKFCLQYVDWSGNKLTALTDNQVMSSHQVLDKTVYSTVYNVSFNELTTLVSKMFLFECPVRVLDVSHNAISAFNDGWTVGLQKLKSLNLSRNELVELTVRSFSLLDYLEELILSNNKLRVVHEHAFAHMTVLKIVDLSDNPLLFSDPNSFPIFLSPLKSLILKNTRVHLTDIVILSGYVGFVYVGPVEDYATLATLLISLDEQGVARVLIARNQSLTCSCINQHIIKLSLKMTVDVDNCNSGENDTDCQLTTPNCPTNCHCVSGAPQVIGKLLVDCRNKNLTTIPDQLPVNSTIVHLEGNKFDDFIDFSHPTWATVIHLYLRKSFVGGILKIRGTHLRNLQLLDLSTNNFELVKDHQLDGFDQLRNLNMSRNNVSIISSLFLIQMKNLNTLDLSYNQLKSLSINSSLQILYLTNNRIGSLSDLDLMAGASTLRKLHLDGNSLPHSETNSVFSKMTSLEVLTLSHNQLSLLVQDFNLLPSSLSILDVSNNSISGSLLNLTFPPNIVIFDLSENQITHVHLLLEQNSTFINLHLQRNLIETVNITTTNDYPSDNVINIHLRENPVMCNCHLINLWRWIFNNSRSNVFVSAEDTICKQPISMMNRSFESVNENELMCDFVEPCPDGCECYSQFYKGVTMDCTKTSLKSVPSDAPLDIRVLYVDVVPSLDGMLDPSWANLTEFYVQNKITTDTFDSTSLETLHHLQAVQLNENCWCNTKDYVSYNVDGIPGKCRLALPPPQCFKNPEMENSWSLVECSNPYDPPMYTNIPICYTLCEPCNCYLDMNFSVVMNCSHRQMTSFPPDSIEDVSVLDLDDNDLTLLPDLSQWKSLTTLYVRNNSITLIENSELPMPLLFVALDHNSLEESSGWLEDLMSDESSLEVQVSLMDNPLNCGCDKDPPNFSHWSVTRLSAHLRNANYTYCWRKGERRLLVRSLQCSNTDVVLVVCLSLFFGMVATTALLVACYFRHRRAIHVSMLANNWCLCLFHEESTNDDKEFDAFISYSSEDSAFVVEELVPGLEGGKKGFAYKVCVHERDWLGGQFISEQIVESVQKSRRTIIVLSENFLSSTWATMEFKVALQQALEERFNRIIVVVPDQLPAKDLMESDLRSFITMNTYLLYSDSRFWEKLLFSMPRLTRKGPARQFPKDFVELMNQNTQKVN